MNELEAKIDRLTLLLESQAAKTPNQAGPFRELLLNAVLASVVGYFIFRIMDHYFKAPKA